VAGSSVFPSGMTVPPTLILTALSQRLGALLSKQKKQ
jgi:choline dehydrogenase-like flavoprotein